MGARHRLGKSITSSDCVAHGRQLADRLPAEAVWEEMRQSLWREILALGNDFDAQCSGTSPERESPQL